jgi:hybrid cluster-associated redox disulfide protein
MRRHALPLAETTVDEVMRRWPTTIRDFLDFRMGCVGCPVGSFHSVDEACAEHGVDGVDFLAKLRGTAQGTSADQGLGLQI